MLTDEVTGWDGVSDFCEDDEPLEDIRPGSTRRPDHCHAIGGS